LGTRGSGRTGSVTGTPPVPEVGARPPGRRLQSMIVRRPEAGRDPHADAARSRLGSGARTSCAGRSGSKPTSCAGERRIVVRSGGSSTADAATVRNAPAAEASSAAQRSNDASAPGIRVDWVTQLISEWGVCARTGTMPVRCGWSSVSPGASLAPARKQ
jgi:hypothetical protein